jgi:hypothetical protein
VAEVEADGLHDLEGRALGEDVGGCDHTRVFLDHGRGCGGGDRVYRGLTFVPSVVLGLLV